MKAPTTFKPGATQTVAVGSSSAASNAVDAQTRDIRIVSSVDAYVAISSAPTASSASFILPAFTVEYFSIMHVSIPANSFSTSIFRLEIQ